MNGSPEAKIDRKALSLAQDMAAEFAAENAKAVILVGSHVRGDTYPESDIDIRPIGEDREGYLTYRSGFLISIYWRSVDSIRSMFQNPAEAGGIIPALRRAHVLYDPENVAAQLEHEADIWSWDSISDQCDAWVAEEITNYAEEVHRLIGDLKLGRVWAAAVMRCVLSFRMGMILAVHKRILYETENQLWNLVGKAMGDKWSRIQGVALGTGNEDFEDTCAAALELYALTASKVKHLLNEGQYDVVSHACILAGHPI